MNTRKTAVVTGATGTIGKAIATKLLEKDYDLIMVVRDPVKAKDLSSRLKSVFPGQSIRTEIADLSGKQDIAALADKIKGPVDVLVNNAAITPRQRQVNSENVEMQWAVNVLGYYRMILALKENLKAGKNPRIVNVASYWAGGLDLSDPEFERRRYDNDVAYRQSKQADRMLASAFAERLKSEGISINSCHPGDANSSLSNSLGFGGHETPEAAAETPVWLATESAGTENTGQYFERKRLATCGFCKDKEAVEKLFRLCASYG